MKGERLKVKGERLKVKGLLIVLFLFHFQFSISAALTVERQQQFTYYWYAAKDAIAHERYTDAMALLEFCHMLNPDDGQTLAFLGIMYDGIGKKELAREAFELAYKADPENQWRNYLEPLKQQYLSEQEWKKALKIQDEIDLRKNEYDAYSAITRYRIYATTGKPKQAIAAIDKYLETDPTNLQFLLFRIELMEQTGARTKDLYARYEQVLELNPMHVVILNNYAYHLATHGGDLKKAERMSEKTIREDPNNPVYLDTYGWILHLQGQNELALFYLNRALWNATEDNKTEIQNHIKAIQ